LEPFAYGLRDHEMFRSPLAIDTKHLTAIETPRDFRDAVNDPKIDVLPLVREKADAREPGWCVYTYEHEQAPELEVICGGVNSKTPKAAAVWRQGNLLHFGFPPSPDRMTDAGRALFVNAICYIARFPDDRAMVRTRNAAGEGTRVFDRNVVDRWLKNPHRDTRYLEGYLAKTTTPGKTREDIDAWYKEARPYLHADNNGRLLVDDEARRYGPSPADISFLTKAVGDLAAEGSSPSTVSTARTLLNRYVPDGPGRNAWGEQWGSWLKENQRYLFFSDAGGYRWYVDSLAKKRGLPTADLRGPARAVRR
jgi:hypothetical protein